MTSVALIHLDRLTHNMSLLSELAEGRPLWPAIKANAYGHGAEIIARHLISIGYHTLCVAHAAEAITLRNTGVEANFVLLSAMLPEESDAIIQGGFEPVICTREMAAALSQSATKTGNTIRAHLKVETGMGRIGIAPEEVLGFLEHCRELPGLQVTGLMSHFPRADEADKSYSNAQIIRFRKVVEAASEFGIAVNHMANSAALLDLPDSLFDAARPGIAIYGLAPSPEIINPVARKLQPVLEWRSKITFLKTVPAGTGLSYGHIFHTERDSLIATIPVGYGDGLHRNLSNNTDVLVRGRRCRQVGHITMDQSLIDVTQLSGEAKIGDEVVIIGRQDSEEITADELAAKLGTINYEVVTSIAARVRRRAV